MSNEKRNSVELEQRKAKIQHNIDDDEILSTDLIDISMIGDDALNKSFQYLLGIEMIQVSHVNKLFHDIIKKFGVNISFECHSYKPKEDWKASILDKYIEYYYNLKSKEYFICKNMHKIQIIMSSMLDSNIKYLIHEFSSLKSIEIFNQTIVRGGNHHLRRHEFLNTIASNLRKVSSIRNIDIDLKYSEKLTLTQFKDTIKNCDSIRLHGCQINNDILKLINKPKLEKLSLNANEYNDENGFDPNLLNQLNEISYLGIIISDNANFLFTKHLLSIKVIHELNILRVYPSKKCTYLPDKLSSNIKIIFLHTYHDYDVLLPRFLSNHLFDTVWLGSKSRKLTKVYAHTVHTLKNFRLHFELDNEIQFSGIDALKKMIQYCHDNFEPNIMYQENSLIKISIKDVHISMGKTIVLFKLIQDNVWLFTKIFNGIEYTFQKCLWKWGKQTKMDQSLIDKFLQNKKLLSNEYINVIDCNTVYFGIHPFKQKSQKEDK